jgi:hypothetical protein
MSATAIPPAPNSTPPRPPGPRGLPWLGTSFMASRDSTKKLSRWARDYGDIVYYHFFDIHVYFCSTRSISNRFCSARPATSSKA